MASELSLSQDTREHRDRDRAGMWADLAEAGAECDCPGPPPPEFLLPPPPRPPFLQNDVYCSEDPLPDIETCGAVPILDASYHSSPSFQTSAVIGICSALLAALVLISILLILKHRRKVQNLIPCKSNNPGVVRCDQGPGGPAVLYEDLPEVTRGAPLPRHAGHGLRAPGLGMEMLDVKGGIHYPSGYPMPRSPPVFVCSSPGPDPYTSQDLYHSHPVYEELSTGRDSDADSDLAQRHESEDDFAEDELSLTGERDGEMRLRAEMHQPPPPYISTIRRDLEERSRILDPRNMSLPFRQNRAQQPLPPLPDNGRRLPRSLDRRRGWKRGIPMAKEPNSEFHEGMLLDALLQFQKNGTNNVRHTPSQVPSHGLPYILPRVDASPYETIPVLSHFQQNYPRDMSTFRTPPKICSQDSSFGSDSGYSNHTHTSGRGRRDPHRLSSNSGDLTLS